MKKILVAFAIFASAVAANAEDKVITFGELPQSAQEFSNATFKGKKIASAQKETMLFGSITEGYKVVFTDGTKIEFDSDGNWKEVSAKTSVVPSELIPDRITKYIAENFKGSPVIGLEKESYGYKVKLATDSELKFNQNYIFIGLD